VTVLRATAAEATPPHAPEVGWPARLLGPFQITGVFWYRFHEWGVRILPEWGKRLLVLLFSLAFSILLRNIRAALAGNLEAVLGPAGWRERQRRAFRTLRTFAWTLTERYERLSTRRRFAIEAENLAVWRQACAGGRGVLLITGHVGNWEVGSAVPGSQGGPRVHVVREEEMDPRAQAFVARLLAERMGESTLTHFAVGDPLLGLALREALQRGEVVALQGDRPRREGKRLHLALFGRPFEIPAGPMALARAAGAPLVPVFVLREGRLRYRTVFHPPIAVAKTADREADLAAAGGRFLAVLEATIRAHPHQWFCFRRLWTD
jgi:lauroyl/myristoyl acyltransferase